MTSPVPHIKYSPFFFFFWSNNKEAGRKAEEEERTQEREKKDKKKQIMTLTMLTMKMKDENLGVIKPAPMMSRKD